MSYYRRPSSRRTVHHTGREFVDPTRKGCKFCGSKTVAWQQGSSGKWYLTEIFEDAEGRTYTEHSLLHSRFCKSPDAHDEEQAKRLEEERDEEKTATKSRRAREDRAAAEEAKFFLELHDLCKTQRDTALDELATRERERDSIRANPTSMDYMTDQLREIARLKRLDAEIAFMRAALGMATDYPDEDA